jgi:hypothetical protein
MNVLVNYGYGRLGWRQNNRRKRSTLPLRKLVEFEK